MVSPTLLAALQIVVRPKIKADSDDGQGMFLPEKLVMVDCEMDGVVSTRDNLLQVGAIKLSLNKAEKRYEQEGDAFLAYLHSDSKPTKGFHRKFLLDVFKKCNESDLKPEQFKEDFHGWLGDWKGEATPVGDCVPTDIAFLLAKGCIDPCDYDDDDKPVKGTFHYEFFDLNSVKAIARQKAGEKFKIDGENTEGIHDALVDCENQTLELNQYLKILLA